MNNFQTILNESQKQFKQLFEAEQQENENSFDLSNVKIVPGKDFISGWIQTVKLGKNNFIIGQEFFDNELSSFICYIDNLSDWNKMDNGYDEWFSFNDDDNRGGFVPDALEYLESKGLDFDQDILDGYESLTDNFDEIVDKFKLPKK